MDILKDIMCNDYVEYNSKSNLCLYVCFGTSSSYLVLGTGS